jgi:hypothetical protein
MRVPYEVVTDCTQRHSPVEPLASRVPSASESRSAVARYSGLKHLLDRVCMRNTLCVNHGCTPPARCLDAQAFVWQHVVTWNALSAVARNCRRVFTRRSSARPPETYWRTVEGLRRSTVGSRQRQPSRPSGACRSAAVRLQHDFRAKNDAVRLQRRSCAGDRNFCARTGVRWVQDRLRGGRCGGMLARSRMSGPNGGRRVQHGLTGSARLSQRVCVDGQA